eukprot:TRINITY_DN24841_c0_g1_i1.p1 TRINITY_DN24841_c0_g1~~TRINITY_DN24841_c0_g1_i1.p1  ORF type:complete len:453 (-),score=29.99 TRINITY_DN24841_c0_g1_i1:219-1577(-)
MARFRLLLSLLVVFAAVCYGQLQAEETHVMNCGHYIAIAHIQQIPVGGLPLRGNLVFVLAQPRRAFARVFFPRQLAIAEPETEPEAPEPESVVEAIPGPEDRSDSSTTSTIEEDSGEDYLPTPMPIESDEEDTAVSAGESSDQPIPTPIVAEEDDMAVEAGDSSELPVPMPPLDPTEEDDEAVSFAPDVFAPETDGKETDGEETDGEESAVTEIVRTLTEDDEEEEEKEASAGGESGSASVDVDSSDDDCGDGSVGVEESTVDAAENAAEEEDPSSLLSRLDGLFSVVHPLSLFRDDAATFARLHAMRKRALDAMHEAMEQAMAEQSEEGDAAQVKEDRTILEADGDSLPLTFASVLPVLPVPSEWAPEWSATTVIGVVLLSLAFVLLVAMMLLSLASILYGCTEPEDDDASVLLLAAEDTNTPLLKTYMVEYSPDDKPSLNNYEPPTVSAK